MKKIFALLLAGILLLAGCAAAGPKPLPPASPDAADGFGIDQNINMSTIDQYLDREDVVYCDLRMLFDPASYDAIGGEADLTRTIRGFRVIPFPYIATLQELPVEGAYTGDCLFRVEWAQDGSVVSVTPNYRESEMALQELFPKDKAIFLMCGGGGYAGMMRQLLIHCGWDPARVYNIGANWGYQGENALELTVYPEEAGQPPLYALWRADYAYIAFEKMEKLVP